MHTVIHMHMWMHMLVLARKKSFPPPPPQLSPAMVPTGSGSSQHTSRRLPAACQPFSSQPGSYSSLALWPLPWVLAPRLFAAAQFDLSMLCLN